MNIWLIDLHENYLFKHWLFVGIELCVTDNVGLLYVVYSYL